MTYAYNDKGQLASRYDFWTDQDEIFGYDGANRLISSELLIKDVSTKTSITYDATTGGITSKPYVDFEMTYQGDGKPLHALSDVSKT